ncbi:MAG: UDP-3-O-acyl-N-acetylglucosamine deacetylase [Fibromonadaceae bacterium]|jgi:UDP-3-O-[3-hydroxymyristoyl] N-acetylglucosamine deacetylase|nr:UDP-3-O-acyl-N-acetylglucosamine deacetylase [Fibromonadaceae bacterium]
MLKSYGISGKECEAELELLGTGADFGKVEWFHGEENPDDFKVIYEGRTSVLMHSSGKKITGAEHLSAAMLLFSGYRFKLNAPQRELPLLDGSAALWEKELEKAGGIKSNNLPFCELPEKEFEIKMDKRFVKFQNTDENYLEIKYSIDRFGQKFGANVKINSAKDLEKILLARTYIFEEELPSAGLSENLRGCGVILNKKKNNLLFENEPAFHKILDFLGDITLRKGVLPKGRFEIFNGGHELHHRVLEKITPA